MKTEYLHIRISQEQKELIERLKGNRTVSEYILKLVADHDKNTAIEQAIQEHKGHQ